MRASGSLFVFQLYDVAEAIRMDELSRLLGTHEAPQELGTRHPAQTRVWFEPPPAVRSLGEIEFVPGENFRAEIHYYSYGVVSLRLERAFDLEWEGLISLSARWVAAPAAEAAAAEQVKRQLVSIRGALVKPCDPHLNEDYVVIRLDPITDASGSLNAQQLLDRFGGRIAQIVRGESVPLAPEEQAHILASRLSYYPADLIVAGWSAALVYDTAAGSAATLQLVEYANTQLLEFRFYDEMLTRTLGEVYRLLDMGTGFWRRWRLAREAERLNTIRLDVYELAERTDNAAKFLSDMFDARMYDLVATKVGVPDYRRMVDEKLKTAGELYSFMTDRLHQSSALILETVVVVILIIELFFLFRGKG